MSRDRGRNNICHPTEIGVLRNIFKQGNYMFHILFMQNKGYLMVSGGFPAWGK